jgi:hypothetical protein
MATGLGVWQRASGRSGERPYLGLAVAAGLFTWTAAAPFALVRPAFAPPVIAQLPATARPMPAQFGDRIELLGVQIPDHTAPGESLRVVTYWRALQEIPRDQRLLIRLMRPELGSAGQVHAVLGASLYPTTLWRPGQIVVDSHLVRADADLAAGTLLEVHLGVEDERGPLLPVTGPAAWSTGDVAQVKQIQVIRR